jgi:hypothetical protein
MLLLALKREDERAWKPHRCCRPREVERCSGVARDRGKWQPAAIDEKRPSMVIMVIGLLLEE